MSRERETVVKEQNNGIRKGEIKMVDASRIYIQGTREKERERSTTTTLTNLCGITKLIIVSCCFVERPKRKYYYYINNIQK